MTKSQAAWWSDEWSIVCTLVDRNEIFQFLTPGTPTTNQKNSFDL
jgi:hypothetical protein